MRIVVGTLSRHVDGCLAGALRTLTIRTQFELRPIGSSECDMVYEVMLGSGFVSGYGTSHGDEVEITVLSPEFVAPLRLRAVPLAGRPDDLQLVWDSPQ